MCFHGVFVNSFWRLSFPKTNFLGMYARSVDIKEHYEIRAQLLLRLSCCASSKKIKPDLQWSIESFSFDFSEPAQTTPT